VVVRLQWALGDVERAAELVASTPEPHARRLRLSLLSARAVVSEALGELDLAAETYAEVAPRWADYGFGLEEAWVRLGLGRCLVALGRVEEGRAELDQTLELARGLGARPIEDAVEMAHSAP
jgi:tetratricopeptide (TPR) repeat protein